MVSATILSFATFLLNALSGENPWNELRFLRLLDTNGAIHRLADNADRAATAIVVLSPESPIEPGAKEVLNQRARDAAPNKMAILGVVSDPEVQRARAAQFVQDNGIAFPVLFDASSELANALGAPDSGQVVVLDATGNVVYRDSIGDGSDLAANFADIQSGKSLSLQSNGVSPATVSGDVTFTRHIAPILYANCTECHRPGQVAPFSLLTYEDASKRAEFLAEVTSQRRMPPWKARIDYGHFEDERRLTARQVSLIADWAKAGAPKGDDADMPPAPDFPEGWRLGTPDVVVEVPTPFEVPADGPDIFQHFVLPVQLPEDRTLVGFEYRPSNPAVAHHAVIFLDASGRARARDAETPEPGFRTSGSVDGSVTAMVGVWTPGMTPRNYPEGVGVRVPKTVDLVLQLHLHPSGRSEIEQSKVALYFSDKPVDDLKTQSILLLGSLGIDIAPGSERHAVESSITLPVEITFLSVFPHLHMIGKEMKVTATLPGGKTLPLIWIEDWNFYWQDSYQYKNPVVLPKGTRIDVMASFDNSAANPFNPSRPPQRVLFGNGSTDEMCFAIFQVVGQDRSVMRSLAPALMQSFLTQWRSANIDAKARDHIVEEAGKLFGRGSRDMLRMLLQPSQAAPAKQDASR